MIFNISPKEAKEEDKAKGFKSFIFYAGAIVPIVVIILVIFLLVILPKIFIVIGIGIATALFFHQRKKERFEKKIKQELEEDFPQPL